jgi:parallel beta-helix repeat protein
MLRKYAALVLVVLLASCGGSGKGPTSAVAPSADTLALVVSPDPADHPDYLVDGVADDVDINLAIRSADSASHWTVVLKPGTYHVQHGISVITNVTLRGSGPGTVIRLDNNAPSMASAAGIIRVKDDLKGGVARRVQHVTIEDFVVDGNRTNQAPGSDEKKFGFYAEGDFITLRRLVAMNCAGYGFDPHATADSLASTNILIEDCESFGNQLDGFTLDMLDHSTFRRNYAHDNDRHGFNLVTVTTGVTLSDNRSLHNGATGLMAQNGTHDVTIQTCEMANNAQQGVFLRDADGCTLLGNTFRDNGRSGLLLRFSDHTTVSGNSFSENDPGSVGRAVVALDSATVNVLAANTISSRVARQGVLETGTSDFNEVKNNSLTLPSQYVVLIGAHSTQSGNQFHVP